MARGEKAPNSGYVTETDVDWSLKHFFVLLFVGAAAAIISSYFLSRFNADPAFSSMVAAAIAFFALLIVMVFQSMLLKSFQLFLWVTLAEAAGLLAYFYSQLSPLIVFGIILFVLYAIFGFMRGRLDLTDHLRVHFGRFSKLVIGSGVAGLALLLAFFYAGLYRANGLSPEGFRFISKGSVPIIVRFVPNFDTTMSANQFFREFARAQLEKNPQFVVLSRQQQEEVIAATGFELRNQIAVATKTPVAADETFFDYFYRVTVRYLSVAAESGLALVPIVIIILAVYTIIRGVMFFLKWAIIAVSYALYRLLLAVKVMYIATEPRSKEIIMTK